MRELYSVLARLAPTELSVLVHGETGTGKELVSRAIHAQSNRRAGPMVVFDAAAVPHELIARELFGHRKGAFTGADEDAPGLFEKADGGTLFLDEIGELPLDLQPHLLRALEQRAIRRVGDTRYRPVDVRIVAATNRDLAEEVREGNFRADLYYRLATVEVVVPPLRDRLDDLPMLVSHFLGLVSGHAVTGLSPQVAELFRLWRWPGNVRELRNVVQRAIPFTDGHDIPMSALPDAIAGREQDAGGSVELDPALTTGTYHEARETLLDAFEQQYLKDLVKRAGGNLAKAARMGGVDRKTLYRLMNRHGLR
jgi:DNA-binding NtrC family response regulator